MPVGETPLFYLSLFRSDGEDLSPRVRFQVQSHRLLSLLGALLVPGFGLIYGIEHPGATDPMWARLVIAGLFLGLFGLSYRIPAVREHYVPAMRAVLYVLLTWFSAVATINGYAVDYAVGLLLTYAVLMTVVGLGTREVGTVVRFAGFGLFLTGAGFALAPEIQTSPWILGGAMGTFAVVGCIVVRARLELETQLRESRETVQSKDRFLAEIGHDIRTSLGTLIGYADMIESEADLTDRHEEYLSRIIGGSHQLEETLNEILRLARSELGEIEVESRPVSLREEVRFQVEKFEETAREKDLSLEVHLPDDEPLEGQVDRQALRRILSNLISNAIRYTTEGRVQITGWTRADRIVLEVRDTGSGMTEEELERAFQPFIRAGTGTEGGTGLGLAIVDRLVREMDGRIEVESEPDEGTRVRVYFDRWVE